MLPIFLHPKKKCFVESARVLLFPCLLSLSLSLSFSLFFPYWQVHFHRSVLFCPFTHHHGPFLLIFTKVVTWFHEMEIETGHSTDLGVFFNELGHGESRDRNRGWKVQKCQSNLAFDLVTPYKLTRKEQKSYACAHLSPSVPEMEGMVGGGGGDFHF